MWKKYTAKGKNIQVRIEALLDKIIRPVSSWHMTSKDIKHNKALYEQIRILEEELSKHEIKKTA